MNYETENIITDSRTHEAETYAAGFEEQYNHIRFRENRVYSDEEILQLPLVASGHIYFEEWKQRQFSCDKLLAYLRKKNRPLEILEIGCGIGWLSNRLSSIPNSTVTGADINKKELEQATRVFSDQPGLSFFHGDILSDDDFNNKFDIVVFAASIQYFPSFQHAIDRTMKKLKEDGEIHILDSHFYQPAQLPAARQRTMEYYRQLGFPRMTDHYFHRCLDELKPYNYFFLYKPGRNFVFRRNAHPFQWVCIKNKKDQ